MSMREEFEAWIESVNGSKPVKAIGSQGWWYSEPRVEAAWAAWKASRAALVVELPVPTMSQYANRHSYNCAVESLGWAKDAIEAAGVQVKP